MQRTLTGLHPPHKKGEIALNAKDRTVLITSMVLDDQEVYDALSAMSVDSVPSFLKRAIRVGVIALKDVITAVKLDYVKREFDHLNTQLERVFTKQLGPEGMKGELEKIFGDNGQLQRALGEIFGEDGTLSRDILDPDKDSTPIGGLRKTIESYFKGKDSEVYSMLDPHKKDSPVNRLREELVTKLDAIKTDLDAYLLKKKLIEKTTQKGFEFEDNLEVYLKQITRPFNDYVERVSKALGKSRTKEGDFTIAINDSTVSESTLRILVETKAVEDLPVTKRGLLGYLDRAMVNRDAEFAIAVSETPLQSEGGRFREFEGNKILCEFADDGLPVEVAYKVARVRLLLGKLKETGKVDVAKINAKIDDIRNQLEIIRGIKTRLTGISNASDKVKEELDGLKEKITSSLDEIVKATTTSG